MKLASIYGPHVCQLPLFRVWHPPNAVQLIVIAKTPQEWNKERFGMSLTDRFGKTHGMMTQLEVADPAKPGATRTLMKKLVAEQKEKESSSFLPAIPGAATPGSSAMPLASENKSVGGGVYGHFFTDLSPLVKALIMDRFRANKVMIREGNRGKIKEIEDDKAKRKKKQLDDDFTPKTNLAMLRAKAEKAGEWTGYDRGTESELEMMEKVFFETRLLERLALRLQRIRRSCMFHRAVKKYWWRLYAAHTIQRATRGMFARRYARKLRYMLPIACKIVWRSYRAYRYRLARTKWLWVTGTLLRVVLQVIKRVIRAWVRDRKDRRDRICAKIQARCRAYVYRNRYLEIMRIKWIEEHVKPMCATRIQRIIRGWCQRIRFRRLVEEVYKQLVLVPAAINIQRAYRGLRDRKIFRYLKYRKKCANMIKKAWRLKKLHDHRKACRYEKLLYDSAVEIQRRYRGRIDRERTDRLKREWIMNFVFLPSVVKVQTAGRRYVAMRDYLKLLEDTDAARCIQEYWNKYRRRMRSLSKWEAMRAAKRHTASIVVQKKVRRYLARLILLRKKLDYRAKTILAAKLIMRAWVNFKASKRLQFLLDENRLDVCIKKIDALREAREEVEEDLEDIVGDLDATRKAQNRMRKRVTELEKFVMQASLRIPVVEEEMANLEEDDIDRGWAESFQNEFESLSFQSQMAREEARLHKVNIKKRDKEIRNFNLEMEETYIELDHLCVAETEAHEACRRAEVLLVERKVSDTHNKKVRIERDKWKVMSNRKNVMDRHYQTNHSAYQRARGTRGMPYAETITYEKRARQRDLEEVTVDKELQRGNANRVPVDLSKYDVYSQPVRDTYDSVIANASDLLRNYTLDERIRRDELNAERHEKTKKRMAMGQFAPLKPKKEFETIRRRAQGKEERAKLDSVDETSSVGSSVEIEDSVVSQDIVDVAIRQLTDASDIDDDAYALEYAPEA